MSPRPTQAQAMFLAILSELPSSGRWSEATEQMYLIGLRSIPDEALRALCDAVLDTCRFRPTVYEIKSLLTRLSAPNPHRTPDALAADVFALIHKGPYQAPHPTIPHAFVLGMPPDAPADAVAVISAMGGWESLMLDASPSGVIRGQILKVAQMVSGREGHGETDNLRLHYHSERSAGMLDGISLDREPAGDPLENDSNEGCIRLGSIGITMGSGLV